jgi:hypothetical protein
MTALLTSTTIGYPFLMSVGLGRPRLAAVLIGLVLLVPERSRGDRATGAKRCGGWPMRRWR